MIFRMMMMAVFALIAGALVEHTRVDAAVPAPSSVAVGTLVR